MEALEGGRFNLVKNTFRIFFSSSRVICFIEPVVYDTGKYFFRKGGYQRIRDWISIIAFKDMYNYGGSCH